MSSFLVSLGRSFSKTGATNLNGSALDMRLPKTADIIQPMVLAMLKSIKAIMLCLHRFLLKAFFPIIF